MEKRGLLKDESKLHLSDRSLFDDQYPGKGKVTPENLGVLRFDTVWTPSGSVVLLEADSLTTDYQTSEFSHNLGPKPTSGKKKVVL